jgi:GH24 family phage-related lysozyme (muramidase)/LAS superfamily LD-carboxypeptidase LdcB
MIPTILFLIVSTLGAVCPGALEMIKHFEGYERCASPDPIGLPTVGYGHLCKRNDPVCRRCYTEPEAAALLVEDLKTYEACVQRALGPLMGSTNAAQYAALVSFTFNLGCGGLQDSTFLRRIRQGASPSAIVSQELNKFVNAGGRRFAGLVRRRNAEIELFLGRGPYASQCRSGSPNQSTPKQVSPKQTTSKQPNNPSQEAPKRIVPQPKQTPKQVTPQPKTISTPVGNSTACTASVNNVNVVGRCMAPSQCGGTSLSVPWFCPGMAGGECCVEVPSEAKNTFLENKQYLGMRCEAPLNNQQASGFCRYTSLCANDGLVSVPGFCPGAENIQCCVASSNGNSTVTPSPKQPNYQRPTPKTPTQPVVPTPKAPSTPPAPKAPAPKVPAPKVPAPKTPAPKEPASNDAIAQRVRSLRTQAGEAYSGGRRIGSITVVSLQNKLVEITTAIQYERMRAAAQREGNTLRIISGFRTMDKQRELYNLYLRGRGNLAARPGFSNHQNGIALDLNPEEGNNYNWLARNAAKFGFCRTVPSERWHWEYRPTNRGSCIRA